MMGNLLEARSLTGEETRKAFACCTNDLQICDQCPLNGVKDCHSRMADAVANELEKGASAQEMLEEAMQKLEGVSITKDEAYSIAEFIDIALIDHIRNDTDVDSMGWLVNIVHVFQKACKISGFESLTAGKMEDESVF